jgi:hypothetical protein
MAISSVEAIDPETPNSSVPRSKGSTIIWVSMSNCCKQVAIWHQIVQSYSTTISITTSSLT